MTPVKKQLKTTETNTFAGTLVQISPRYSHKQH